MEIITQDTYNLYKEMLTLEEEQRGEFFDHKLIQPFEPVFEKMHMPKTPEALGCMPLCGYDIEIQKMLSDLIEEDAWNVAQKTIER